MVVPPKVVAEFTRQVRLLIQDISTRIPDDPRLERVKRRVALAVDVDPVYVYQTVGRELFRRNEQIYSHDENYFLVADLEREVDDDDASRGDLTRYMIPKVRLLWTRLTPAERTGYFAAVENLLDLYLEGEEAAESGR